MSEQAVERALVIGDGAWGTTLALSLARAGVSTTLWSAFPEQAEEMRETRRNERFLPGISLDHERLAFSADAFAAAEGADFVLSVVPTQFVREVAQRFEDALKSMPIVTASKGLEMETFKTPSQILTEVLGERPVAVLTGPSHAEEVARGLPASVVCASADAELAARVQATLTGDRLRVYTSDDVIGAELGGALKNVIALAAGISDGLELGDNAKSALITRGMVEMARFGASRGARAATFFGLAGIGDLVTTCCSRHSRNRHVGEEIGRGKMLPDVLASMQAVAEGVWTTKALFGPDVEFDQVALPIAQQVHAVLFEQKDPREGVLDLMRREPAGEMDGLMGLGH
jgi:glycerol-3-phosphate dehydrogenase (NAD(P)+)